ncbi:hypothetical protein [Flavobacterium crassostreae]|uniref:Secreted protein n=1 Tax=Flavobacterium crassostreae TaxID=1763534 RepID=A0A1B9E8Z0_9FLAO|nr:hypothetical protein [Flavobacterium crassostreae]OCB78430.1 hypothetical protein LPBF_02580 [Flavobacterium crassostreae]
MKTYLYILALVLTTTLGYSQNEFRSKFKAIPPVDTGYKAQKPAAPLRTDPIIVAPNLFKKSDPFAPPSTNFQIGKPNPMSMTPKTDFVNPGDEVRDRMNKKEDPVEGIVYRKNQNLGDFKTSSRSAKVWYRDAAYVDGDQIRVYLNDVVIQQQVNLNSDFKGFEIELQPGFNKIDFEALNQGSSGPNTAEFKVYDAENNLISASQWNLGTGFKATIILIKE